ncbi:MAG: hypothetical protein LLG04_14670 [Parachlamydia sp.]|nr:hypothetical protein [Parachlamydia sp.]
MHLSQKCLMGLTSLCLLAQPLVAQEKAPAPQLMTETELLKALDEKDQATYRSLNADGKALVLKMASLTNDPIMQKCKQVMGVIQNMRDLLRQFEGQMQEQQDQKRN